MNNALTGSNISDNLPDYVQRPPHKRLDVWGWSLYDVANHGFATTILAVIFNRYYAGEIASGKAGVAVDFFGSKLQIPGATLFTYFVSISTLFVMFIAPITGAMADEAQRKKLFLILSTIVGVVGSGLLYYIDKGMWLYGGIMFGIANIGFSAGLSYYDAMLKDLAKPEEVGWVSGFGWSFGYVGGGLLLLINLLMLQPPAWLGIEPVRIQVVFLTVAIWWVLFSIPLVLWVKEPRTGIKVPVRQLFTESWQRLMNTMRTARRFPDLLIFLAAFFFFNNGVQTVIMMAAIFGDQELQMTTGGLIAFFLMIQGFGFVGSLLFGKISDRIGDKTVLLITISVWAIVCIWSTFIGLFGNAIREFYIIGIIAGMVLGASQSSARSLFARCTPLAHSAEFFGFYSVQARFSTLLGPVVYGTVLWITGSIRMSILCLLAFFVTGGLLLWFVNEERGSERANMELAGE